MFYNNIVIRDYNIVRIFVYLMSIVNLENISNCAID